MQMQKNMAKLCACLKPSPTKQPNTGGILHGHAAKNGCSLSSRHFIPHQSSHTKSAMPFQVLAGNQPTTKAKT
jgi:hypothetical protein